MQCTNCVYAHVKLIAWSTKLGFNCSDRGKERETHWAVQRSGYKKTAK